MFRLFLRAIGLWCLAGAFVAALIDGMKTIAASRVVLTAAATVWTDLAPATLRAAQAAVETRLGPEAWSGVAAALTLPTFVVLALVGSVFVAVARPARPKIGIQP